MFYENAKHLRSELVDCLVSVTPQRYDLVEVCCPWDSPLSKAVEQAGGRAFRMGIHNGFDLSTKAGLVKAMAKIRELKPRYVHVSPPCNPWTSLQNACQGHADRMKRLQVKRQHGRRILRNCLKLIQLQRQELDGQTGLASENHAGGEHPLRALSWNEPSMRKMVQLCGVNGFVVMVVGLACIPIRVKLPFRSPGVGLAVPLKLEWPLISSANMFQDSMLR